MKKGALFLLLIPLISSVSAFDFDVGGFLDKIGYENLFLLTIFVICFALINFALSGFFGRKDSNDKSASIVSVFVSLLITFYIYQSGFNIENYVSGAFDFFNLDFGLSSWIAGGIIILLLLNVFFKFKLGFLVFSSGFILLFLGLFSDMYLPFVVTGIALMIVGWIIMEIRKSYKKKEDDKKAKVMSHFLRGLGGY